MTGILSYAIFCSIKFMGKVHLNYETRLFKKVVYISLPDSMQGQCKRVTNEGRKPITLCLALCGKIMSGYYYDNMLYFNHYL